MEVLLGVMILLQLATLWVLAFVFSPRRPIFDPCDFCNDAGRICDVSKGSDKICPFCKGN